MNKFMEETELWMSSGGTSSLLHSHADHNMHCVLAGRKDFILIHPKYKDKLAFHSNVSESDSTLDQTYVAFISVFDYYESCHQCKFGYR